MAKKNPELLEIPFENYLKTQFNTEGRRLDFLNSLLKTKDLLAIKIFHFLFPDTLPSQTKLGHLARYDTNFEILKYYLEKEDAKKRITKKEGVTHLNLTQLGNVLLSEASLYGAEQNVRLFLQSKFDPNYKDSNGQTALHKVVIANNSSITKLLLQYKASINSQDKDCSTPLHLAKAYGASNVLTVLLENKANKTLKNVFGQNYLDFAKAIFKKEMEFTTPLLKKENTSNQEYHKAVASLFKGIIANSHDRACDYNEFSEAIKNFKQVINSILSGQSTPKFYILRNSLNEIINISSFYKNEETDELRQYIIDAAKKLIKSFPVQNILGNYYNLICCEYLGESNFVKAMEYSELALDMALQEEGEEMPNNVLSQMFFNAGLATKFIDAPKALQYFSEAEKLDPDNEEVLVEKIYLHVSLAKDDAAFQELAQLKNSVLKELIHIDLSLYLGKYTSEELKSLKLPETGKQVNSGIYNSICLALSQQNAGLVEATSPFQLLDSFPEGRLINIVKILGLYHTSKDFKGGLAFLTECNSKYDEATSDNFYSNFTYYNFIFYEGNGLYEQANFALNLLKKNCNLGQTTLDQATQASKIRLIRDLLTLNQDSFQENLSFLKSIASKSCNNDKDINLNSNLLEWYKILESLMLNNLQKPLNQPSSSKEELPEITDEEPEASFASVEWIMTEQEGVLSLNQQQIHQYFTRQKQALLQTKIEAVSQKSSASWQVEKVAFKDGEKNVLSIEGKANFYATIDGKLLEKNDLKTQELFSFALKKGEVSKSFKSVGIKFLKGVVELKINEGDRLYTNVIYKNLDGKYLIIFDHKGNHGDVTKANKLGLTIQDVKMADHFVSAEKLTGKHSDLDDTQIVNYDNNNNLDDDSDVTLTGHGFD